MNSNRKKRRMDKMDNSSNNPEINCGIMYDVATNSPETLLLHGHYKSHIRSHVLVNRLSAKPRLVVVNRKMTTISCSVNV